MSGAGWVVAAYFAVGWCVATSLWIAHARPQARREGWRWTDWIWWVLPMLSVPGWILTLFWPFELIDWMTGEGEGRHRA